MKDNRLTYGEIIEKSKEFLIRKDVPSAKCDAEWIVSFLTNKKRVEIYLEFDNYVPQEQVSKIRDMVVDRGSRRPLQHLLGCVEFCNLKLKCDERALIPRPETERLVEIIIERLDPNFSGKILDLGTGSGAIVLALCNILKYAQGTGLDCSTKSLALAEENLSFSGIEKRVTFDTFDWLAGKQLEGMYDLVVSNPPYLSIQEWEQSQPEVKIYDPKLALVSEKEGLQHIEGLINVVPKILKEGGIFCLEIGHGQADLTRSIMDKSFQHVEVLRDLSGVRRFIFCRN